jgi:signal transduction histidine kinase
VQLEMRHLQPLLCYEGEIRQALSSILLNAVDAMAHGGTLRIRVGSSVNRAGKPSMRITVADDGHGMPQEVLQRIFEPFFTTRGTVGTGLGLWVAMGILERHAGTVRVRTSTGERSGSVFLIWLPYAGNAGTLPG